MQALRSHSDLLNQNLQSNKIPRDDCAQQCVRSAGPDQHSCVMEKSAMSSLWLPPSAHKSSPLGFRTQINDSRSMIPQFDCTLKSLGELLKIVLRPHPCLIKPGCLALVFYDVPHNILMCNRVWTPDQELSIRPFTSFLALIFCENANIPSEKQNCCLSFTLCLEIGLVYQHQ